MPRSGVRAVSTRVVVAGLVAVVALLPAGCGDDKADAREAVEEYLDEVGEQQYGAACGYLTDGLRKKLGGDCSRTLATRYERLTATQRDDLDDVSVDSVDVSGNSAKVRDGEVRIEHETTTRRKGKKKKSTTYTTAPDLTRGDGYTLVKVGDSWKIDDGV